MKKLNVILVYNKDENKILMCKRAKEPYKGKLNLVGGKVEPGEDELNAAYRELQEETAITKDDITLFHIMNFQYIISNMAFQGDMGTLNKEVKLVKEVNELYWVSKNENFFDSNKFAGEGNIGHMVKKAEMSKSELNKLQKSFC